MKKDRQMFQAMFILGMVELIALLFGSASLSQELDQRLVERFKSEAPLAWRANENRYERFFKSNTGWTVEFHQSGFFPTGKGKSSRSESSGIFKRIGTDFGLITINGTAASDEVAHLYNRQYFASLTQSKEIQGWKIGEITKIPGNDNSIGEFLLSEKPMVNKMIANVASSTLHPFGYCPIEPMEERVVWIELENFQIDRIEQVTDSKKNHVKVQFRYTSATVMPTVNGSNFEKQVKICEATFDPNNNWCLIHFEGGISVDGKVHGKTVIKYEYETINGVQFCTKRERRSISVADQKVIEEEQLKQVPVVARLRPVDFTLSAFGLPEPDWYKPPRPWWLYSSLTGMGLLVAGALFLRYGKGMWNRN